MLTTIKSTREIDLLFGKARRAANNHIVVLVRDTPAGRGPQGRVAFIAGKKTGGAVSRNRSKRVLRAAVHRQSFAWPGKDVALIARPETGRVPPSSLDESLRDALVRAGAIDA